MTIQIKLQSKTGKVETKIFKNTQEMIAYLEAKTEASNIKRNAKREKDAKRGPRNFRVPSSSLLTACMNEDD